MLRKLVLTIGGGMLLGTLCFGRDAASYVGTSFGWVKDTVKNAVPLDFEIDRARTLLKNLVPEIRTNMHLIAREEVEAQRLNQQIADLEARLDKERAEILRLKNDLASGEEKFRYAGRTYTVPQVKADLCNRFERFKTNEATAASLREMHAARLRSLDGARHKLENMLAVKRQLEVDTEQLEARLKMVEAAQTTSTYNFDDSQLSRAKELITDLKTRLDVAERLVGAETKFNDQIPLDAPARDNIVDEIGEYFSGTKVQVATTKD